MHDLPVRPADDIDDVLVVLDDVCAWAMDHASPLGYFAVVYRLVTAEVRTGIDAGLFDDGERMARLDTLFANRYLEALDARCRGGTPTRSWALAFDAAEASSAIVLQHLLVGISAHINLDLGVAVAATAGDDDLAPLRRDFDRINAILATLMTRSQADLAVVSPWLGWLDTLGGRTDDTVVRFSIEVARRGAWQFATAVHGTVDARLAGVVDARDGAVVPVGRAVLRPGWLTPVVWLIGLRESDDVRRNLEVLAGVRPPAPAEVEAVADTMS